MEEAETKFSRLSLGCDDYDAFYEVAKKCAADGELETALDYLLKCEKIRPSDKLTKKINRVKKVMNSSEYSSELQKRMKDFFGNGFVISEAVYERLYDYQIVGVKWMWELYIKNEGGILGDEMGCPEIPLFFYHGSPNKRSANLKKVIRRSGVLITSYSTIMFNADEIIYALGDLRWNVMIMDEGHKLKNNQNRTVQAIKSIPARMKLILTGTAIQNNLEELWSLFDIINYNAILGSKKSFKTHYELPITCGREKDASKAEKALGSTLGKALKEIIDPFILRRTKAEITQSSKRKKIESINDLYSKRKYDLILWCKLTQVQIKIYRDFLELAEIKELLNSTRSPLVALGVLKKICDHPRLLSVRACLKLGLIDNEAKDFIITDGDEDVDENDDRFFEFNKIKHAAALRVDNVDVDVLIQESGKLVTLTKLLERLVAEQHRILVFSMSKKILDILEKILKSKNFKILRMDGSVKSTTEREQLVRNWQNGKYEIFLLTSQVGGVGLTLTAADRVVIYDPSWNPATDDQAVDRACRIGQNKNVIIYRLITCGTIEEKIYRRQIFKKSLFHTLLSPSKLNLRRYFSKQQLRELFKMDDPFVSVTKDQIEEIHGNENADDSYFTSEIEKLKALENCGGVTNHSLMNKLEAPDASTSLDESVVEMVNSAKKRICFETDKQHVVPNTTDLVVMSKDEDQIEEKPFLFDEMERSLNEIEQQIFPVNDDTNDGLNSKEKGDYEEECISSDTSVVMKSVSIHEETNPNESLIKYDDGKDEFSSVDAKSSLIVEDSIISSSSVNVPFANEISEMHADVSSEDSCRCHRTESLPVDSCSSSSIRHDSSHDSMSSVSDQIEILREAESEAESNCSQVSTASVSHLQSDDGEDADSESSDIGFHRKNRRIIVDSSSDDSFTSEIKSQTEEKLLSVSPIKKRGSLMPTARRKRSQMIDKENADGIQCPTSTPICSRANNSNTPLRPLSGYQLFERELTNASLKYSLSSNSSKASKILFTDESGKDKA